MRTSASIFSIHSCRLVFRTISVGWVAQERWVGLRWPLLTITEAGVLAFVRAWQSGSSPAATLGYAILAGKIACCNRGHLLTCPNCLVAKDDCRATGNDQSEDLGSMKADWPKVDIRFVVLLYHAGLSVWPVAYAMGLAQLLGIYLSSEIVSYSRLQVDAYALTSGLIFVVIPMFVLMGAIAGRCGYISRLLLPPPQYLMSRLARAAVDGNDLASGWVCRCIRLDCRGSSRIYPLCPLPEMLRFGYNGGVLPGLYCRCRHIGRLIPPSIRDGYFLPCFDVRTCGELLCRWPSLRA